MKRRVCFIMSMAPKSSKEPCLVVRANLAKLKFEELLERLSLKQKLRPEINSNRALLIANKKS